MRWLNEKAALAAKQKLCSRQWVEVFTSDAGQCITTFAPTNQKLAQTGHLQPYTTACLGIELEPRT